MLIIDLNSFYFCPALGDIIGEKHKKRIGPTFCGHYNSCNSSATDSGI